MPRLDLSEFAPAPAAAKGKLDLSEFAPTAPEPEVLEEPGTGINERAMVKYLGGGDTETERRFLEAEPGGPTGKPQGTMQWYDPSNLINVAKGAATFVIPQLAGVPNAPPMFEPEKFQQYETKEYKPGHLAVRPKGTTGAFRAVDPDTGFFSSDFARDVADLGPEILMGAAPVGSPAGIGGLMAGESALRKVIGSQFGFDEQETPIQHAVDIAGAGVTGYAGGKALELAGKAAAPVVAPVARWVGKQLQKPEGYVRRVSGEVDEAARKALEPEKLAYETEGKELVTQGKELGVRRDELKLRGADVARMAEKELGAVRLGREEATTALQRARQELELAKGAKVAQEKAAREAAKKAKEVESSAMGARKAGERATTTEATVQATEFGKDAARHRDMARDLRHRIQSGEFDAADAAGAEEAAGELEILAGPEAPRPKVSVSGVPKSLIAEAERRGVDPKELQEMARYIRETEQLEGGAGIGAEHREMLEKARKVTGLTPGKISKIEEAGQDYSNVPGFDEKAGDLAAEFDWSPEAGADHADRLWQMLKQDLPKKGSPGTYDQRTLDKAMQYLKPLEERPSAAAPMVKEPAAMGGKEEAKAEALRLTKEAEKLTEKAREIRSRSGLFKLQTAQRDAAEAAAKAERAGGEAPPGKVEIPPLKRGAIEGGAPRSPQDIYGEAMERGYKMKEKWADERAALREAANAKPPLISWKQFDEKGKELAAWAREEERRIWGGAHSEAVAGFEKSGLSRPAAIQRAAEMKAQAEVSSSLGEGVDALKAKLSEIARGREGLGIQAAIKRVKESPEAVSLGQERSTLAHDILAYRRRGAERAKRGEELFKREKAIPEMKPKKDVTAADLAGIVLASLAGQALGGFGGGLAGGALGSIGAKFKVLKTIGRLGTKGIAKGGRGLEALAALIEKNPEVLQKLSPAVRRAVVVGLTRK